LRESLRLTGKQVNLVSDPGPYQPASSEAQTNNSVSKIKPNKPP
jgi:hypothetical protein